MIGKIILIIIAFIILIVIYKDGMIGIFYGTLFIAYAIMYPFIMVANMFK